MEDNQKKPVYEEYNASLDPDDPISTMSEDELQESLLEDSNMNGFQKWVARMDEKKWRAERQRLFCGQILCTD